MSQLPSLTHIPQDNAALSDEITRLAGHINAAQHRFLTLLAALIERDAWADVGVNRRYKPMMVKHEQLVMALRNLS